MKERAKFPKLPFAASRTFVRHPSIADLPYWLWVYLNKISLLLKFAGIRQSTTDKNYAPGYFLLSL